MRGESAPIFLELKADEQSLLTTLSRQFEGREGGMTSTKTTIWPPGVRVTLDEYGEVEDTERGGEEVTKQGTKRKGAPRTKGPCEHGVK